MADLTVRDTAIPGLLVVDLPVHGDARGWFKENWQRAKMTALGLPDFRPVQHSIAYNGTAGVTRGIHAEPWDKLVSVAHGRIFGAWVDLREGPTFGAAHTEELDEHTAVFVPRGVGNAYQALVDGVVYSYLVNDHWSPHADYTMLNLADESVAIPWPIPLDEAEISEKDRDHPRLGDVIAVTPRDTIVLGANGQLGRALTSVIPGARGVDRAELDLSDPAAVAGFDFSGVGLVINAAAYTAVDLAETPTGRRDAWATNATGVAALAQAAIKHGFTLVHYSSDYVFDGTNAEPTEQARLSPLSAYGASKAAGDLVASTVPCHYIIRTAWVVGDGKNFVRTMSSLATQGISPEVVADQIGRLTFTDDLVRATLHLVESGAEPGTYNVTSSGAPTSWAEVARRVFAAHGRSTDDVRETTTADYALKSHGVTAPRPGSSVLNLDKITRTGLTPPDQIEALAAYLAARGYQGGQP